MPVQRALGSMESQLILLLFIKIQGSLCILRHVTAYLQSLEIPFNMKTCLHLNRECSSLCSYNILLTYSIRNCFPLCAWHLWDMVPVLTSRKPCHISPQRAHRGRSVQTRSNFTLDNHSMPPPPSEGGGVQTHFVEFRGTTWPVRAMN